MRQVEGMLGGGGGARSDGLRDFDPSDVATVFEAEQTARNRRVDAPGWFTGDRALTEQELAADPAVIRAGIYRQLMGGGGVVNSPGQGFAYGPPSAPTSPPGGAGGRPVSGVDVEGGRIFALPNGQKLAAEPGTPGGGGGMSAPAGGGQSAAPAPAMSRPPDPNSRPNPLADAFGDVAAEYADATEFGPMLASAGRIATGPIRAIGGTVKGGLDAVYEAAGGNLMTRMELEEMQARNRSLRERRMRMEREGLMRR
jgi:hypothetical protein